jgi:CRISPR/Cas system-associated exonuclease Cas4 (RecB family)
MKVKTLDTLVEDIFELFNPEVAHEPSEENLEYAAQTFKDLLRLRLAKRENLRDPLRFSSLGKKDRQIWYMAKGYKPEDMSAKTYFKFLYGDVIETLVLFLAKEAGHSVEELQSEVSVDGVKGHIDAIIDGTVVDVKSASPFGYKKFEKNEIVGNDPFGYVEQLAGYANVLTPGQEAAWIAFDKVSGDICVSKLSSSIVADYKPEDRIAHLKEVIESEAPPERCYEPVEDGKSGNMKLDTGCSYCGFKHACWPELRMFAYSTGPRYLTTVAKTPDVPEILRGTEITN